MQESNMIKLAMLLTLLISGCATLSYSPPAGGSRGENVATRPPSREAFWKLFVSNLSGEFFVINNLDKETGLINVSYSGDPEQFVDCGLITITSPDNRQFPASRGSESYNLSSGIHLFRISRQMELQGRVNIIVQEPEPSSTRVLVNTRYTLARRSTATDMQGRQSAAHTDSVSFNYGQDGTFPPLGNYPAVTCRSTGNLERHIITTAQKTASTK
jgi:hypothetical protein